MNYVCAANYQCYGPITSNYIIFLLTFILALTFSDELSKVLIFLYLDAALIFLLSLYLEAVLPREYGVPKHPLFFVKYITSSFQKLAKRNQEPSSYFDSKENEEGNRLLSVKSPPVCLIVVAICGQ